MSNYRLWPIAALAVAVIFFLWESEDQPEKADSAPQTSQSDIPSPIRQDETQTPPVWRPSGRDQVFVDPYSHPPTGYNLYTEPGSGQPSSPGGFRFRPNQDTTGSVNRYVPVSPQILGLGYTYTLPEPSLQAEPPVFSTPRQPESGYRFRPLDKKRQGKRWHGNYGQMRVMPVQPVSPYPYHPNSAPSYVPQSPTTPKSLWANSWPDPQY